MNQSIIRPDLQHFDKDLQNRKHELTAQDLLDSQPLGLYRPKARKLDQNY